VFGVAENNWFKMASVDQNGKFIEARYTEKAKILTIDLLTWNIWE
jgi:hypothetical protein